MKKRRKRRRRKSSDQVYKFGIINNIINQDFTKEITLVPSSNNNRAFSSPMFSNLQISSHKDVMNNETRTNNT